MEPVTQALLGAATAHVVAGRALGRRALVWGALVGMSPDIDVVAAPLHDGFGEWLYHRGTTHSLWFGFVFGPLIGWALWRWRDPERATSARSWIALAVVALVTHPLLDGFTPYGTQLFAPFWRARFAWNGVAIVDPLYTLPLALGVACAASGRLREATRRRALLASLALTTAYLFFGIAINDAAESQVRRVLEAQGARVARVRVYPTVLQPWLRYFVAHGEGRRYVGLHSSADGLCPAWREVAEAANGGRSSRAAAVLATWQGALLEWFADGEIAIYERETPSGAELRIDDLRYGWASDDGHSMWGVEARFGRDGQLLGPPRRFDRGEGGGRSVKLLLDAIAGALPPPGAGWARPVGCLPEGGALAMSPGR